MENSEAIEILQRNIPGCDYDLSEAVTLAISALEKQESIKSCTPPSDDWEHYADRLHDIAYQSGYEQGKRDAEQDRWIPVTDRLPKCEQEVLICTKEKTYIHEKSGFEWCVNPIVTPAIYEDGTMLEVNSKWHWEYCDWAGWDEEEDCGIIPEGWWENRRFNPDGEYNCEVDVEVVAWRPIPEPYTEEET